MADLLTSKVAPWIIAGIATSLTACGGSDSTNKTAQEPPAAPQLTSEVAVKKLTLNWESTSNTDYYRVYANKDGNSGFEAISNELTSTSFSHPLAAHLTNWHDGLYLVEACNSDGCTESNSVSLQDQITQAIGYLKPGEAQNEGLFGFAVTLSGDGATAAVGMPNLNNGDNEEAGATFIYTLSDSGWQLQQRIDNPATDGGEGDLFGYTLALSENGNTLAVGAPFEDSSGTGLNSDINDNDKENSGAVYTFNRSADSDTWQQQHYIKADNADSKDYFGLRVALNNSGSALAVSAPYEASNADGINGDQTDNSIKLAGAVYVYQQDNANWIFDAYIKPPLGSEREIPCFSPRPPGIICNDATPARFGYSLAFANDGGMLAIGSPGDNASGTGIGADPTDITAKNSGAVHILTNGDSGWGYSAYIKSLNTEEEDEFGYSLSLSRSGNLLAVGAPREDATVTGITSGSLGDEFFEGSSPELGEEDSGAVYLYAFDGTQWSPSTYIKAENADEMDLFGWSVSLSASGDTLAVGAPRDDSEGAGIGELWDSVGAPASGSVFVYTTQDEQWQLTNYLKAPNTNANDTFGRSIALSGDGQTLIGAATGEDSTATDIDGDQSNNSGDNVGAVYLY
ncbi:FG-GAP repeat protein [Gilvimarinus sp. 1_MG-2023]|uniref:FG-GAP repeat protein n=1 Tax=Gilvimarinus sp. 1_MG-2023 TaxID=3062638 RepID=UPI0026E265A9|nr:FG-GAP repeat protein [Gilvimarinus sp. 1_MG-2023]MDO6747449.1 FG-GAP repeat protein [Gilvimarinus sp. 1_MG-2023]